MTRYVAYFESLQPYVYGVNCGPAAVFLAGAMWAGDGIFRPYVSTRLDAEALVAWEHLLSLVLLAPLGFHYLVKDRKPLGGRQWLCLLALGVGADAVANTLITLGYALGHLALVALLQQSQPVFGLFGAWLLLREDLHSRVAIPLAATAIGGLFLMMWPYVREARQEDGSWSGVLASACGLGAALIWALETVVGRWLLQHSNPPLTSLELLTYRQFIGLTALLVYVYVVAAHPVCDLIGFRCLSGVNPSPGQVVVLALMAIIELGSHLLYYVGLSHTPASVAVIMELSHPLLILTVVPPLTTLVDPEYQRVPLEGTQIVGAVVLMASAGLLGVYTSRHEGREGRPGPALSSSDDETPRPPSDNVSMTDNKLPNGEGLKLDGRRGVNAEGKFARKSPSSVASKFSDRSAPPRWDTL